MLYARHTEERPGSLLLQLRIGSDVVALLRERLQPADGPMTRATGDLAALKDALRLAVRQLRPDPPREEQVERCREIVGALGKELAFLRVEDLKARDRRRELVGLGVSKVRIDGEAGRQISGDAVTRVQAGVAVSAF